LAIIAKVEANGPFLAEDNGPPSHGKDQAGGGHSLDIASAPSWWSTGKTPA